MPAVIVDVDETICDISSIIMELREKYGDLHSHPDKERIFLEGLEKILTEDLPPIPGSVPALNRLHSEGYRIYYLSARPRNLGKADLHEATKEWLERNGFPEGELHLVDWSECGRNKIERIIEIADKEKKPIFGIGDRFYDMLAYSYAGVIPVLFHNPKFHVRHEEEAGIDHVWRISSWEDFIRRLEERPTRDFVVSAFLVRNSAVLLVRHRQIGLWIPPGGHIEKDERPDEAVVREVKEETGMDVEFLDEARTVGNEIIIHQPNHIQVEKIHFGHEHINFVYFLKPVGGLQPTEEVRWFTAEELEKGEYDGTRISESAREFGMKAIKTFSTMENGGP